MARKNKSLKASGPTFRWDDLDVLDSRRDFLDFLLLVAGKIDKCAGLSGKRRLTCLARQADVERTTVLDWFKLGRKPEPENLRAMADATETPLPRFWMALGWTTAAELAAALDQEAPRVSLTPKEEARVKFLRTRPPEENDALFEWYQRYRWVPQDADQT